MRKGAGLFLFVSDLLFPGRCLACEKILRAPGTGTPLILPAGWPEETVEFLRIDFSYRILGPLSICARLLCPDCWLSLVPASTAVFTGCGGMVPIITPFITDDLLLRVVKYLKFEYGRAAVVPLAWWIASALKRYSSGINSARTVILPVPLYRGRRTARGYNQAELLASEVASILSVRVETGVLKRTKKTKPQSKLQPDRREVNVEGAFTVSRPELIIDKDIILIDDLITTGETVKACIKALHESFLSPIMVLAAGRSGRKQYLEMMGEDLQARLPSEAGPNLIYIG